MTPEQVELKPCPFCGGEAKIIGPVQEGGYCVECPQCLASSKLMYPLMDDVSELLTEAWNTRHVAEGGGWQKTIGTWADATFPTSTQATIIAHLRAEANDEIGVDCDPMELADVGLLLLHLAHKRGVDLYELMREKHKINQSRKWEARPNDRGFMSHLPAPPKEARHGAEADGWRPRSDHPKLFEDGETMLVAVPVRHRGKTLWAWELSLITIECDEGYFGIRCNDDTWGWSWEDVEYYMSVDKLLKSLPAPPKEAEHDPA